MLQDELVPIASLVDEFALQCQSGIECNADILSNFQTRLEVNDQQIRAAWNAAAFSGIPDHSLRRYFHFHLEGIREILDTLHLCHETAGPDVAITNGLLDLIHYQRRYFGDYFNDNGIAPLAFCESVSKATNETAHSLKDRITNANIDPELVACLMAYFKKANFTILNVQFTYGALFYYEHFLKELHALFFGEAVPDLNAAVAAKLTELNFNALDFFCYKKQVIKKAAEHLSPEAQLKWLNNEIDLLGMQPETRFVYDQRLPSLSVMLKGWLAEEIVMVRETIGQHATISEKLSLNLSVAHLACITRLFFEENLYNAAALTAIFKFIAGHYQTKRQTRISTGSLSKEYYSISQVTAAVVRDKLLKMVSRLNREYFPAMVVTGAAGLLYSALR